MKKNYLLIAGIALCMTTISFSQSKVPATGMKSSSGNFTTFTSRPVSKISTELLNSASEQIKNHPNFGVLPLNAPCVDCYEDISKRTEDTRHFILNGTKGSAFFDQQALGVINYKDKNGNFCEKDINIYETGKAGIFESNHQEEPIQIDLNAKFISIKSINNSPIKLNNNLELWGIDKNGNEKIISTANWVNATVGSSGLKINDIFPGITLEAFALSGAIKTNFIINAFSPLFNNFKWLVIKDKINDGVGKFNFKELLGKNGLYNCDADIVSENGNVIAKINQGIIYDKSKSTNALYYKASNGVLAMYVDVDYLKSNTITYPVVVDPLVTSSATLAQALITGSRYNASCNFTNSCDYNLNVNSPANATITDVTFSMSYAANGLCYEQDGAMRIGYLGCVSPNTAGFYWFCNVASNGTCNGNNLSIYSDISSCIPAPSCTPYPMTFTLKLYRSCWGNTGTGCNNSACIGAAAPFVVNVMGKTLETLSNTTTGNGITTQVATCGGSALLNPATINGIGPYTYTWNPSGANTPTFTATSVTSSQTITCDVMDACGIVRTATFAVNPNPSVPSAAALPTQTLSSCNPSATFTPTYNSSSAISSYVWQGPGIVGSSNTSSVVVNLPGVYSVSYTNTAGCSASSTYSAVSGPPSTTASPQTATINCINTTATLSPVYSPSADLTYSWSPVGAGAISGSATNASVVLSQPGIYQVTITNTVTTCQSFSTYTVTDATQPPVISALPQQSITCITPTVTIAPSYTPSTGVTYSWVGPGLSLPSINASITTTQVGNFTVTATAANGCTAVAQYTVVDNSALPSVSVQGGVLTCAGPLTLSTTVNPSSGSYTYSWTGNGIVSATNTSTVNVNAAGNYSVNIINAYGCGASASFSVANNSNIPLASQVSATITCTNINATLTPLYTPSAGLTYTWTPIGGGNILGSANNASVAVSQAGIYQVSFINTLNGCQSSNTYTVFLDTQAPLISPIATQTITCNTPTILINPTYTPSTGVSFVWTGTGITTPSTTASISTTQAGIFTVTATAANGCTATAQYSVVSNVTLLVATAQNTVLPCNLNATPLTVTVNPVGTYTYNWTGSGIVSGGNSSSPNVNMPGNYSVTVTDANGCSASTVVIVTSPAVTAAFTPTVASGPAPFNVNFINQSTGGTSFQWTFGDGKTSTAQDPSNTYEATGTYTVLMVATNGTCTSTTYGIIMVDENSFIEVPNVFTPNGDNVNDLFTLKTAGIKDLDLDIFNRWGEKVFSGSGITTSWNGSNNGKIVAEGTYFFVVKAVGTDDKKYEKKGTVNVFR